MKRKTNTVILCSHILFIHLIHNCCLRISVASIQLNQLERFFCCSCNVFKQIPFAIGSVHQGFFGLQMSNLVVLYSSFFDCSSLFNFDEFFSQFAIVFLFFLILHRQFCQTCLQCIYKPTVEPIKEFVCFVNDQPIYIYFFNTLHKTNPSQNDNLSKITIASKYKLSLFSFLHTCIGVRDLLLRQLL